VLKIKKLVLKMITIIMKEKKGLEAWRGGGQGERRKEIEEGKMEGGKK